MFYEAECYALEGPVRSIPPTGLTSATGLTDSDDRSDRLSVERSASAVIHSKDDKDEVDDWRKPLIKYLQDPKSLVDRKV